MERRHDWFIAQIGTLGARRVLEIGCGTGETAAHLAAHSEAEIVAVDISQAFVTAARSHFSADNLRYELFDLMGEEPLAFGRFDLICGNGILHHLVLELPRMLRTLRAMTNPGGGIAFIEPNFLNPYCAFIFGTKIGRRFARLEPDEMAFTRNELQSVLAETGWGTVTVETRDFLVPGLPECLVKPVVGLEPMMQATRLTRWLAQSHFVTARV